MTCDRCLEAKELYPCCGLMCETCLWKHEEERTEGHDD